MDNKKWRTLREGSMTSSISYKIPESLSVREMRRDRSDTRWEIIFYRTINKKFIICH